MNSTRKNFQNNSEAEESAAASALAAELPDDSPRQKSSRPFLYVLLTYAFSLCFWLPAIFLGKSLEDSILTIILFYLGGGSPFLFGILLVYLTRRRSYQKEFWNRLYNPKRIAPSWYGFLFLANVLPTAFALVFGLLLRRQGSDFFGFVPFITNIFGVLVTIGFNLLACFVEEPGWRGYLLDGFLDKHNSLVSSLLVGVIWSLWHIPLFFINGTYQNQLGFGSVEFWLFMLGILFQTVLIVWVFQNNNRSTLSAFLFHFLINILGEMFEFDLVLESVRVGVYFLFALVIVCFWLYNYLKKKEN